MMGKRRGLEMETKIEQVGKRSGGIRVTEEREPGGNGGSELWCSCMETGVVFGEEPLSFEFQSLGDTPGSSCWYLWVYHSQHKEKLRQSKWKTPEFICTPNGFGVLLLLPFNSTAGQVILACNQSFFESQNKKEIKRYYFYAFKAVVDPVSLHKNCKSYP